jgi:rubrerythrin
MRAGAAQYRSKMMKPVRTLEELYAHALAIEREARDRYAELQGWFRERGEEVLAGLCANLAKAEDEHFRQIEAGCRGLEIPAIDAAEYQWPEAVSPEVPGREVVRRAKQPRQVLLVALAAERNAAGFYEWVAATSPDERVRALAHDFAAEEEQHVRWVRDALEYHPA